MKTSKHMIAGLAAATLLAFGAFHFFRADNSQPVRTSASLPVSDSDVPAPITASSEAAPPTSTRMIVIENGKLSLTLHDQALGPVLADIAKNSRVSIYSTPAIDTHPVTIAISNVPLEQGLQELLQGYDVFVYKSAGVLRSAWVYDRGAGAQLVPVPPESWASTADVERQMHNGSPPERISAIETLVGRNGPNAGDIVNRALLDDNEEVRLRGLDVALSAGVNVSRETLTSLTYDSSAAVRILALQAIASGTAPGDPREAETEQLIRRLMGDPSAEVREKAAEILDGRRPGN